MSLHLEGAEADPYTIESRTLTEWGLPDQVVMRHRTPQFAHIFSTDSYAAGYYCYLWADVLVADVSVLFKKVGFFDPSLTQKYHDLILSKGGSVDPLQAFTQLRGRGPLPDALMRDRGFID